MKILLISTSFEDESRSPSINYNSHYPIGVAYLHSYLESKLHLVESLFLNDYPFKDCLSIIEKKMETFNPDVVGFNILTNNRTSSFAIIEYIHNKYPETHILAGGIHATVMHQQILNRYPYLIVVLGEGEITVGELLERLEKKQEITDVAGLAFSRNGLVQMTQPRELISNLDILPFPKHEAFFTEKRTTASIITSRGCPFNCSFCVLDNISRRKVRFRSVENVIREIEYLILTYPQINTIWIHDDVFFIDNKRAIQFCNEIIKKKIKLKFICSGRFKPISRELIQAMEKAGFILLLFGLESGSPKILKYAHKNITQEDVITAIKLLKNSKIIVTLFLIIGLYQEDDSTIKETIKFVKKLQKINYIFFQDIGILTIYPGTEIFEIAKNAGQINDDYWLTEKATPFFTVEHSIQKLNYYKNMVLDNIALMRIFTLKGFFSQIILLSAILGFFLKNISKIPFLGIYIIQRFYPNEYFKLKKFLNHLNPGKTQQKY